MPAKNAGWRTNGGGTPGGRGFVKGIPGSDSLTACTFPEPSSIRNVYSGRFRRFRSLTPMFAMRAPGGAVGLNGLDLIEHGTGVAQGADAVRRARRELASRRT